MDFVRKGLEGAALVGSRVFPVVRKLNDGLEAGDGGGDLQLEDSDEVGSVDSGEVNDDRLRSHGRVGGLGDTVSELGAREMLF